MSNLAVRSNFSSLPTVEDVERIKSVIIASPQIPPPSVEHFLSNAGKANGVYGRMMRLNAGELIIGKIHKFEQLNVLAEGEAVVRSPGVPDAHIKAPHVFVGGLGAERVIFALTDLTWITAHSIGEETDIKKIEDHLVTEDRLKLEAP